MLAELEEENGAEVIDFSDAGRGHNSDAPRREYLNLRKSVWESDASTAEKLVALAIIEHMQPGKLNAYPSQARILKMCSVSARTFRRAFAMVRAWFDIEVRPGRATVYSVKIVRTSQEIASLLGRIRECQNGTQHSAKTTPSTVPKWHPTPGQNGTLPPAKLAPQKRPVRDQEETKEEILFSEPLNDAPEDSPPKQARPYSQPFEDFWKRYPRKEGKGKAYSAWKGLNAVDRKVAAAALERQLPMLLAKAKEERGNFCPHAGTWLGQRRFDDEISPSNQAKRTSSYGQNGAYVGKLI